MAINLEHDNTTDPQLPALIMRVNNGDLQGIESVMAKWGFNDEASMLRFAIAVLLSAENNRLYADGSDGKKITLTPTANLLNTDHGRTTDESEHE